jgi:hypothetical protein
MGISAHVFSTLRGTVQQMSAEDCLFCIMFDKISVRTCITIKFACIEGFDELESYGRMSSMQIMPWFSWSVMYVKSG